MLDKKFPIFIDEHGQMLQIWPSILNPVSFIKPRIKLNNDRTYWIAVHSLETPEQWKVKALEFQRKINGWREPFNITR